MNQTVNQVTPGVLGGAVAVIFVWGLQSALPAVEVTNEVAIAFSVVFTFIAQRIWRKAVK